MSRIITATTDLIDAAERHTHSLYIIQKWDIQYEPKAKNLFLALHAWDWNEYRSGLITSCII